MSREYYVGTQHYRAVKNTVAITNARPVTPPTVRMAAPLVSTFSEPDAITDVGAKGSLTVPTTGTAITTSLVVVVASAAAVAPRPAEIEQPSNPTSSTIPLLSGQPGG